MAGEKKQKARLREVRTPRKLKTPERHVVGSSSTWKDEELERLKVQVREVDVKQVIPEKWFEFGDLKYYQSGMRLALIANIVRDELTCITTDHLSNTNALVQKARHF